MRLIEDVSATGGRRMLRHAYIWYRFSVIVMRDALGMTFPKPTGEEESRQASDSKAAEPSLVT